MPALLLALDTSGPRGSVALLDAEVPDAPLFEESFASDRSHNALLFGPLGRALEGIESMGPTTNAGVAILAGLGPGSYTGTRVGIAAATGLALAHGWPCFGHCSFAAFSRAPRFHVIGDARRGTFFLARMENSALAAPPEMFPIEELEPRLANLPAPVFTPDAHPLHPSLLPTTPDAAALARAFLATHSGSLPCAPPAESLEPIYLRAAYITAPASG